MDIKPGLTLKEECEARMRRSSTRESSRKRHLRSHRHSSSSSSSSSSSRSSRKHRSRSRSSSYESRSRRKSKHSSRRRSRSRSSSDRGGEKTDRFGRKLNPNNVTNSKDPKMVASRIFLGSLPPDLTREDVELRFSKHGKILGITLLQGYGFVQFQEGEEAVRAVQIENNGILRGQHIDVRLAVEGKKKHGHGDDDRYGDRRLSRDGEYPRPPHFPPYGDPYAHRGLPPLPPHMDPYRRGPLPPPPGDPYVRGPLPPPHLDPYLRGPPPHPYHRGDPYGRGPPYDPYIRGPPPPPIGDPYRRPPYPEPYPYSGATPPFSSPPAPPAASVDCEIIVVEEKQRLVHPVIYHEHQFYLICG